MRRGQEGPLKSIRPERVNAFAPLLPKTLPPYIG